MAALIAIILTTLAMTLAGPAPAEVVAVEGLGARSLAGFDCVAISRSATIGRVCHDAARARVLAEVGGRWQAYCDVPRDLVDAWLAAPSMGRFHAQRIATGHRCEQP